MRPVSIFLGVVVLSVFLIAAEATSDHTPRPPLAATFSIVALNPDTGEPGAAIQSHWFSGGSLVPWAEFGVGAVATQSFVEVAYGPVGLRLLREGKNPKEALNLLS